MVVAMCASASAAGVFNCQSRSGPAKVQIDAVFSEGESRPSSIRTRINLPAGAPEALRSTTMWIGSLTRYRMGPDSLAITVGRKFDGGAIELKLDTRSSDGSSERGDYRITATHAGRTRTFSGRIACDVGY